MTNSKTIIGDVKEGTYNVKEILKNKKGETIIKYTTFIDGQKFSMSRYDTYVSQGGELETFGDHPTYKKYYPNTCFETEAQKTKRLSK